MMTEVMALFAGAVRIAPESPVPYRSLAGYYLSTNSYPDRALALTDLMMRYAKPPNHNLLLGRYDWSITLGVRAQALASVGRHPEADSVMNQAFAETDTQFQPGMAWLHDTTGRIKQLQQDTAAAATHFQQAHQLDPDGESGRVAQRDLAHINTTDTPPDDDET